MKDFVQILFAGAVGALAAYFNVLAVPLVVLVAVMLIDYVTGMAGASVTGKLNSRVGHLGKSETYPAKGSDAPAVSR